MSEENARSKGLLIIIAAPSGGGKTSLVKALLKADPKLSLSISHTTRTPRPGESSGEQYHFVRQEAFRKMVRQEQFLEHALVFGNYYGTHAGALAGQLERGLDVILEIDWQGAAQVRRQFPESCSIFILPPSLKILQERLSRRGQDSTSVIARRMKEARSEISHWNEFDHLVVNEDFEEALKELQNIIEAVRRDKPPKRREYPELVAELLGNG